MKNDLCDFGVNFKVDRVSFTNILNSKDIFQNSSCENFIVLSFYLYINHLCCVTFNRINTCGKFKILITETKSDGSRAYTTCC